MSRGSLFHSLIVLVMNDLAKPCLRARHGAML